MSNKDVWERMARPPKTALKSLEDRFNAKVSHKGENECWEWQGAKTHYGYGKIRNNYKSIGAHRLSYILHKGEIPSGIDVLHKCDNRLCVNPNHLFLGTQSDNMKDMFAKGRNRTTPSKGSANGNSKLSERDIPIIKALRIEGKTYPAIAKEFRMSTYAIREICIGNSWRHV